MKTFKLIFKISLTFLIMLSGCQDDDTGFGSIESPTNLQVQVTIVGQDVDNPEGDGSGMVDFTATAQNASSYRFIFSDGTEEVAPSGTLSKRFTQTGVNEYSVTVIASGIAGISTSTTLGLTVLSNFTDEEAVQFLTGGSTKTWYWAASEAGHLGVGQNNDDATGNYYPNFYQAVPFEKAGSGESECLYEDELVFTLEGNILMYELSNGGQTYFNGAYEDVVGGNAGYDFCYDFDTSGVKTVSLSPSESFVVDNDIPGQTRGTTMTFSDEGFMGYYVGTSTYEILSITENRMVVRAIQGNDDFLAWYHVFTTLPPEQEPFATQYENLVWSDEFDVNGAPDPTRWTYDIGAGGWGNAESQYYTDRTDNAVVENGILRITAIAENFNGSNYTSARLKTEDLFEFTYGRVEVRARVPSVGGTWPAIWMLGEDYTTNIWPACGEIDIMEHVGNNVGHILGTTHSPNGFAGTAIGGEITVPDATSEFHVYGVEWRSNEVIFLLDGEPYFTYSPATIDENSFPFDSDYFIILNIAMGGTLGGAIDPAFTQDTMEIDYVRVYQ
ncbi:MAG: family 16 glycosylhydrolase [Bacteroidota bacterium]